MPAVINATEKKRLRHPLTDMCCPSDLPASNSLEASAVKLCDAAKFHPIRSFAFHRMPPCSTKFVVQTAGKFGTNLNRSLIRRLGFLRTPHLMSTPTTVEIRLVCLSIKHSSTFIVLPNPPRPARAPVFCLWNPADRCHIAHCMHVGRSSKKVSGVPFQTRAPPIQYAPHVPVLLPLNLSSNCVSYVPCSSHCSPLLQL